MACKACPEVGAAIKRRPRGWWSEARAGGILLTFLTRDAAMQFLAKGPETLTPSIRPVYDQFLLQRRAAEGE